MPPGRAGCGRGRSPPGCALTLGIAGGFVLGLLHARLGRLLVLGSGRERLVNAMACRHGAVAFRGGDGKARCAQSLDHPAGDPDVLAVVDRHLPGALGRAHLGAFVRQRSAARRIHPRHSGAVHRRRFDAVRLARADAQAGRAVCADFARRCAGVQQSLPHHRLSHGFRRHALSLGAGGLHRRKDFGRRRHFSI